MRKNSVVNLDIIPALTAEHVRTRAAADAAKSAHLAGWRAHAPLAVPGGDHYPSDEAGIALRGLRADFLEADQAADLARVRLVRELDRAANEKLVADLREHTIACAQARALIAEHENAAQQRYMQACADREAETVRRGAAGLPSPAVLPSDPTIERIVAALELAMTSEPVPVRDHTATVRKLRSDRERLMAHLEEQRIAEEEAADLLKRQKEWDRAQEVARSARAAEEAAAERVRQTAERDRRAALAADYAKRTGIAGPSSAEAAK